MDDCINSQIISMDGLLETVKEHNDSLLHHLIFLGNFLIAGDECFMAGHARIVTTRQPLAVGL